MHRMDALAMFTLSFVCSHALNATGDGFHLAAGKNRATCTLTGKSSPFNTPLPDSAGNHQTHYRILSSGLTALLRFATNIAIDVAYSTDKPLSRASTHTFYPPHPSTLNTVSSKKRIHLVSLMACTFSSYLLFFKNPPIL